MAKRLRKEVKKSIQKIQHGIKLEVLSTERFYEVKFGMHKAEMKIPENANPTTNPECFTKKVRQKEATAVVFDVFKMQTLPYLIIRRQFGSSSKEYRTYEWTGKTLRMTRSTLADDRPILTHEQLTDIARHLIHV
jgi:hypothetical protein